MTPAPADPIWEFLKDFVKTNLWEILVIVIPFLIIAAGFFFKIPKFFKLLYCIRKYRRGDKEIIGEIIKILDSLKVPEDITQPFKEGGEALARKNHRFSKTRNLYFHTSDIHEKNPFCASCFPKLFPVSIFDKKSDRWKCAKCEKFNKPFSLADAYKNMDL